MREPGVTDYIVVLVSILLLSKYRKEKNKFDNKLNIKRHGVILNLAYNSPIS